MSIEAGKRELAEKRTDLRNEEEEVNKLREEKPNIVEELKVLLFSLLERSNLQLLIYLQKYYIFRLKLLIPKSLWKKIKLRRSVSQCILARWRILSVS